MSCPRLVIAGTSSGVGKTSLTLGITAALRRRGLKVQTFKVGPDFLDPTWLSLASGRPCINLDGWMCGPDYVQEQFAKVSADADIAIVEGVMGLFDGADPASAQGSTAEIARWLDAPVLLVVNAHGMARSLAALVKGYAEFDPELHLAGVIANRCGSARHADWLGDALAAVGLPPLAGAVMRDSLPSLPSRHLGLVTADRQNLSVEALNNLADAVERQLDMPRILGLAEKVTSAPTITVSSASVIEARPVRIGLAFDEAFHFYYPDNLQALEEAGATLVRFSPMRDNTLPDDLDALFLGGGYPEEHAVTLEANHAMRQAVADFAAAGQHGCIVAISGEKDLITDGDRVLRVANGVPLMTRVTGLGCGLSATTGAFCAVAGSDLLAATAAAFGFYGLCGQLAFGTSDRPGSFFVAFLDALYSAGSHEIHDRLRIE